MKEKYGDHVFFSELSGRRNVVCFKSAASRIIHDRWYDERETNLDDEVNRILDTAAKLLKNSFRLAAQKKYSMDTFPSVDDVTTMGWIPKELQRLLGGIIDSNLKIESIGQCIVKAAMPRSVLPPILFALSVQLHHMFGSRWQLSLLDKLGFSLSYGEVTRFKKNCCNV